MLKGYMEFNVMLEDYTNKDGHRLSLYNEEHSLTLLINDSVITGVNQTDADNIIPVFLYIRDEAVRLVVNTPTGVGFVCKRKREVTDIAHVIMAEIVVDNYRIIKDETITYDYMRFVTRIQETLGV